MPKHAILPTSLCSPYKAILSFQRLINQLDRVIDNIFANKYCGKITSRNIISDISDHYSQFCLTEFSCETDYPKKTMIRDFSRFSEEDFNSELAQVDLGSIFARTQGNVDIAFSNWLINMLRLNLYQSVNLRNP